VPSVGDREEEEAMASLQSVEGAVFIDIVVVSKVPEK